MSVIGTRNRIENLRSTSFSRVINHLAMWARHLPREHEEVKRKMKRAYSSKNVGGYLLAFFLLFGLITVASSSAQAQYPWGYGQDRQDRRDRRDRRDDRDDRRDDRYDRYDRDDRYRDRNYGYQTARQQGYSYGLSVGAGDAQRGQSYNPQRSRYWKNATEGFNSSYGNKGQYKQVFRDAFEQGYREGFQRYAYNRRDGRGNRWPRN